MTSGFVHDVFASVAAAHPEWIAIEGPSGRVSYGQLAARAAAIARALTRRGVAPGSRVVLFTEDRRRVVEGVLGVLWHGSAFVPLMPSLPIRRLETMIATCDPGCAIADAVHTDYFSQASGGRGIPTLDERDLDGDDANHANASVTPASWDGDGLSYLVFTSGSTGTPKAIAGRMKAIDQFIRWEIDTCGIGPGWRVSQLFSPMFDAFLRDAFTPLCSGGTICLVPGDETALDGRMLGAWLRDARISLVHTVPSVLRVVLDHVRGGNATEWPDLRRVLVAGEPLLPSDVKRFYAATDARLVNLYGPSETTMTKFAYEVAETDRLRTTIPIGKPMPGAKAIVVDDKGAACPPGVVGEILIRTPYRSLGYYGRPDLTRDVFVPNPFNTNPADIVYKTGDLARVLEDGNFELLGRRDHQVKVRGVRIELGEIEAAIGRYDGVRQSAAIVHHTATGTQIAAYVVVRTGVTDFDPRELRRALRGWLPVQAVPEVVVLLDEMPLTSSGKVDRARLPVPRAGSGGAPHRAARDGEEEMLCAIVAEVLKCETVGIDDDFFELGGHSLLAAQVASRIRRRFGIEFSLRTLFEYPAVSQLAGQVRLARASSQLASAPPPSRLPAGAERTLSHAQQRLWFISHIEPSSAAYNLAFAARLRGPLDRGALRRAIAEIVRRHEVFRTSFVARDGAPMLHVDADIAPLDEWIDLRALAPRAREAEVRRLAADTAEAPFDLARAPLLRVRVIGAADDDHVLAVTTHHIIADAWSASIFVRELMALYEAFAQGLPSPLPELPLQYADITAWERSWLDGSVMDDHLAYWRARLEGCRPVLELPTDVPRSAVQSFRGDVVTRILPPTVSRGLTRMGRAAGATDFMVMLALLNVWLSSYSGHRDMLVGTPMTNRHWPDSEDVIGLFLNTLILRNAFTPDMPFTSFLESVRANALEAYAHQMAPFERLVDELRIPRDASRNPLFQVMLNLESITAPPLRLANLEAEGLDTPFVRARVDLHLGVRPGPEGFRLLLIYNASLFRPATAATMLAALGELACVVVESPEQPIGRLIEAIAHFVRQDEDARKRQRSQQQIERLRTTRRLAAVSDARK